MLKLGEKLFYQHCWAEFYLPGYGWVPVDPADVRKAMLVDNLKLGMFSREWLPAKK